MDGLDMKVYDQNEPVTFTTHNATFKATGTRIRRGRRGGGTGKTTPSFSPRHLPASLLYIEHGVTDFARIGCVTCGLTEPAQAPGIIGPVEMPCKLVVASRPRIRHE